MLFLGGLYQLARLALLSGFRFRGSYWAWRAHTAVGRGFAITLGAGGTTTGDGRDGAGTVNTLLQWGHLPFLPAKSSLTLTTFLQCGQRNLIDMIVGVRCERGTGPLRPFYHRP